ncbi:VC0807 family protein [Pseudonocardia endophytica]|uniref:Intracellular septation protein A n=1 Tax=Pseudonocardia endophytica TaxID=401976 RepID=A0A4R1HGL9_PSEEN|nr:hypothetical protein EV378_3847 [Pseudonocardia endophytica]
MMIADRTERTESTGGTDRGGPRMGKILRGLLLDVGLPVVVYYALHLLGADDWVALLAATGAAALRIVWGAVARRELNLFAVVMLLVYGLSLVMAVATGDPRLLLLKGSLITGGVAAVFLTTAFGRRPLTLAAAQSFEPDRAAEIAEEFRTQPAARRGHRVASTVWGVGLAVEALVRLPVIFLLPIPVATGVSEGMLVIAFVLLIAWNAWYVRRLTSA